MAYFAFVFSIVYLFGFFYMRRRLRLLNVSRWALRTYDVFFAASFVFGALLPWLSLSLSPSSELLFRAALFACFIGLFLSVPLLIIGDLARFVRSLLSRQRADSKDSDTKQFRSRRNFLSTAAITVGAVPFSSLLVGIGGRYRYKLHRYELQFANLPKAFDNYTIVQLSDLHLGSFDDLNAVKEGLDLVNDEHPDLLLFTGDMVNNKSEEADPFVQMLRELRAKDGKYSVLGNHDYGTYNQDFDVTAARADVERLIDLQRQMGFKNLRNESVQIRREGTFFQLVGVENWGAGRFLKAGDLAAASNNLDPEIFTLLMSHDPSHWEAEILDHNHPIDLTLSGHTHGFQYGIEVAGWQWSPAKLRYPQWAGMYEKNNRLINVNRGFGFLGYPGRFGIWPEITVIRLKSA